MIKNIWLKNMLTNTVFRFLSFANTVIPKDDNLVLVYCNMGFRDNLKYLYDYMIENNYNTKYRIIRSQSEPYQGEVPENVKVVGNAKAIPYFLRAGHVIYSFGKLPIYPAKKQRVIQTWHGTPFKGFDETMQKTGRARSFYTYALASSEYIRPVVARLFSCGEKHVAICGQPRTDVMVRCKEKYEIGLKCNKLVLWTPTFRKSSLLGYQDIEGEVSLLPVFSNQELARLNDRLKELGVGLIVKLHPSQDLDGYEKIDLSNIYLLSHKEFTEKGWDLYCLLAQTDGLITDYSSIFYDYLLLNRPLAFTIDDYEAYKDKRGFAVEDPDYLMAGDKIRNADDFMLFIENIANGTDIWADRRKAVNDLINKYKDGRNRERALRIAGISIKR